VLENFFDQARKIDPIFAKRTWPAANWRWKSTITTGAKTFREALKKFPEDPDVHFGLARAYEPSADR